MRWIMCKYNCAYTLRRPTMTAKWFFQKISPLCPILSYFLVKSLVHHLCYSFRQIFWLNKTKYLSKALGAPHIICDELCVNIIVHIRWGVPTMTAKWFFQKISPLYPILSYFLVKSLVHHLRQSFRRIFLAK